MRGTVALVTGGGGFVGRHLVRLLRDEGAAVRVLDPSPARIEAVEWVRGSILEPADLARACAGVDVVFHLAAEARLGLAHDRYHRVNVAGTAAVLEAAERHEVRRVIVTSTAALLRGWNDAAPAPIRATAARPHPTALAGPYTRSKLEAERLARAAAARGLSVHVLHPTVPIGPGDPTPTPPTAMLRLFARRPPPFFLPGSLNLIDVRDVALAHLRARDLEATTGSHLVAGADLTMADLLARLERLTGRRMPRRRIAWPIALTAAAIEERLPRAAGTAPTSSVEGVRLMRHPRRHDAAADLVRLGLVPRPIDEALAAGLRDDEANAPA